MTLLALCVVAAMGGCTRLVGREQFGLTREGSTILLRFVECFEPPDALELTDEDKDLLWAIEADGVTPFPDGTAIGDVPSGFRTVDPLVEELQRDLTYRVLFANTAAYTESLTFRPQDVPADAVLTFEGTRMSEEEFLTQGCP